MKIPFGFNLKKIEIPGDMPPEVIVNLAEKEYRVFILKFAFAAVALLGGIALVILGVTSESVIELSFRDAVLTLNNALPGVVLAILGFVLMVFSRLSIKIG